MGHAGDRMKLERETRGEQETPNHPPRFGDKLPIASARVQALKASYRQAWLYFLLAICLGVAWWVPIRYALTRFLMFRPAAAGPRDAYEFVALAYEGISRNPGEVTPERFRAQVAALRNAGYHTITLSDITALYRENRPLPRKAILMTFDHSRKSSYFDARRVLQRAGWTAVMFLWTKPILDEDPAALRWPYIRSMLRSGAWEAGAQSQRGFETVLANSAGERRNFMTTPQWFPAEMRYETPEAFRQRLMDDHQQCRGIIAREIGAQPAAYAFPYGDFGQYDERAVFTRRLNLDLLAHFYELGFIHGNTALNTRYNDPRRLNRLLVQSDWTADDLLQRLEHAWPCKSGYTSPQILKAPLAWLPDWGEFQLAGNAAVLQALPDTTGAKVWLNGSDLYDDLHLRLRVRITNGQFGMFFRASPDGESYLYLVLTPEGEAWLRQKHAGMQPFTLGAGHYTPNPGGEAQLDVYLRDRLFYATAGGHPIFQEIISTRGGIRPGMVGCSLWYPRRGQARAEITALDLKPSQPALITFNPAGSRDATLAYWLSRNAFRYTHFAPPWMRVFARGHAEQFGWDAGFYGTVAKIHRLQFQPEIVLENLDGFENNLSEEIARTAAALPAQGVLCNLSQLEEAVPLSRITTWLQLFSRALDKRGLTLIARLPPIWEKAPAVASLFQGLSNLTVAVTANSPLLPTVRTNGFSRIIAVEAAAPRQNGYPIVFHELTGGDAEGSPTAEDSNATLLREEGYAALHRGDFDEAVKIWRQWSALDPRNAEPLALIGDVYLQQDEIGNAIDAYGASLEQNPGQVGLVARCARLMYSKAQRGDEARAMLDLYERLFPDNPDIILAQAERLIYEKQPEAAAQKIQQLISKNPGDLDARGLMHRLLPTPVERFDNIRAILKTGGNPAMERHMLQTIERWNLLRWPESWPLMNYLANLTEQSSNTAQRAAAAALLPRTMPVREEFNASRVSDNWIVFGDPADQEEQTPLLTAAPAQTEAVLRLTGSDTMHNGFIEAGLEDARGFFWLYARREDGNMIRFGFEQVGQLYLQIWRNGQAVANQTRVWTKPPGIVRLRLELRGGGASGYINDQPAFGAPIAIPPDLGLGWWGMAPWSPKFGVAQAQLREVAGGPLPVRVGVFKPRDPPWNDADCIKTLQPWTRAMSAIAPPWFAQEEDGAIRREITGDFTDLRILCRYYQIRLLPCVRAAVLRTLKIQDMIAVAQGLELNGFTLMVSRMPGEEWCEQIERSLLGTGLTIMVMRTDEDERMAEVREFCPFNGLFAGPRRARTLPLIDPAAAAPADAAPPGESVQDGVVLFE